MAVIVAHILWKFISLSGPSGVGIGGVHRGGDSTILYLDSRLAHMLELSFSPLLCFAPIYLCSFTFKVSVPRVNIRVYDLLLVHGCYSGSYFVSAAYICLCVFKKAAHVI